MVLAVTWGAVNQVGWWTFLTLWIMRLSAKLNLFLGVPQLNAGLLPAHLQFLKGYLTKKPMNALFPISMIVSIFVAAVVVYRIAIVRNLPLQSTGLTLVATLIVLAIIEHVLMIIPIPLTKLWDWRSRAEQPVKVHT